MASIGLRAFAAALVLVALPLPARSEASSRDDDNSLVFNPAVVSLINSNPAATWVAGYNERVHGLTKAQFKGLLGAYRHAPRDALPLKKAPRGPRKAGLLASLPSSFDAREKWSHCPTIAHIRDQGHCGSCWAFGAVETLSDRFCVHFNESVDLSTEDLLSCCGDFCGDGCEGGWPYKAWLYFSEGGVVTEDCQPYFDQSGCKHPGCEPVAPTPACTRTCASGSPAGPRKHFAMDAYFIDEYPEDIMWELYHNGPVEVAFDVYEDFAHYKSGVYKHLTGDILGGHAVKFVGWGTTEDGVKYWLVANSWNKSWGEDGYFRIVRGTNECGIEEEVVAGIPSTRHLGQAVAVGEGVSVV